LIRYGFAKVRKKARKPTVLNFIYYAKVCETPRAPVAASFPFGQQSVPLRLAGPSAPPHTSPSPTLHLLKHTRAKETHTGVEHGGQMAKPNPQPKNRTIRNQSAALHYTTFSSI